MEHKKTKILIATIPAAGDFPMKIGWVVLEAVFTRWTNMDRGHATGTDRGSGTQEGTEEEAGDFSIERGLQTYQSVLS